jgi:hypothetical protein
MYNNQSPAELLACFLACMGIGAGMLAFYQSSVRKAAEKAKQQ